MHQRRIGSSYYFRIPDTWCIKDAFSPSYHFKENSWYLMHLIRFEMKPIVMFRENSWYLMHQRRVEFKLSLKGEFLILDASKTFLVQAITSRRIPDTWCITDFLRSNYHFKENSWYLMRQRCVKLKLSLQEEFLIT